MRLKGIFALVCKRAPDIIGIDQPVGIPPDPTGITGYYTIRLAAVPVATPPQKSWRLKPSAMNKPPLGNIYSPGWISRVGDRFLGLWRVLEILDRAGKEGKGHGWYGLSYVDGRHRQVGESIPLKTTSKEDKIVSVKEPSRNLARNLLVQKVTL